MSNEMAKAVFGFEGTEKGDLSFVEGDLIEILEKSGDWWRGQNQYGEVGFFPYNRVEVLKNSSSQMMSPKPNSTVAALAQRQQNEKIRKVAVDLKDFKKQKRNQAVFEIEVSLQSGDKSVTQKAMTDFRHLDDALQKLDPNYVFQHTLPPVWADEIPLSSTQAKARGKHLTKYLANNTASRDLFDLLILEWIKNKKNDFKAGQTSDSVLLRSSDSKNDVMKKIKAALCNEYQNNSSKTGADYFSNGTGSGSDAIGKLARVRFDWAQRDDVEISLVKYEFIVVLQETTKYEGWWYGQKASGKKGLFPNNYILVLDSPEVKKMFKVKGGKTSKNMRSPDSRYMMSPGGQSQAASMMSPASSQRSKAKKKESVVPLSLGPARARKREDNYQVPSIDAFDDLRTRGVTLESGGKVVKWGKRQANGPRAGDLVSLTFSAYVWDPQNQQLREFASSDKLEAPPKGVNQGQAGASGMLMEFVIGKNETIDGLEEAVRQMELNQSLRVAIAPKMGYGDIGCPPEIPNNCYLVYDLKLIKILSQTEYKPRKAVFSVGISKAPVANRPQQRSQKEFRGFKSINMMKGGEDGGNGDAYRQQMGFTGNAGKVDTNAYKGKLSLKQLQDIVKAGKFDEYGIVPKKVEDYLADGEYMAAFGMDKTRFLLVPQVQKKQMRRAAKLA